MKRMMDILGAGVGLILLSPVIVLLWVLIRRNLGTPVLFRQIRPGKDGVPFEMIKFRTMKDGTGPDSERLTPLGAKLRSSSLDELPELWNVLKGEMSLVGPRPLLMEYLHFQLMYLTQLWSQPNLLVFYFQYPFLQLRHALHLELF